MNEAIERGFQGLLHCLEDFIRSETVAGKPILVGETTIIPVFRVNIGLGAGQGGSETSASGTGTGAGASIVPYAVISVTNGETTVLPLGKSSLQAITEMLPDIMAQVKQGNT